MTGPTRRDLENWIAELRGDAGVVEIIVRDEVIATLWEPDPDAEAPSPGTSVTRYYRNEAGEWASEDGGQHDG